MARKEFRFKGKTMQELVQLSNEDFANLLNSRGKRSILRGVDKPLMKKVEKAHSLLGGEREPKIIRTHKRDAIVMPKMVGLKFAVHKGNEFQIVQITEKMLGHYLGELAMTRKRLIHGKAGIGATRSSTAISARG